MSNENGKEEKMTTDLRSLHSDHRALQEHLADIKARHDIRREELNAALAALEAEWRNANAELIEELSVISQQSDAKEKELRAAVLAAYQADPTSKTVAPGLSVRVTSKLVYNKDAALAWAKAHDLALALDVKAFEAIAKAQPLEFVSKEESVIAVLGTGVK